MRTAPLFIALILTACGQSGALYLPPEDPAPPAAAPPAAAPAPAEKKDEKKETP